ncbi:MAG: hypothetical protein LC122_12485 [Chitinophagales bacterium]|nr:hypothetical protein [Chitinophagales bacterium]
MYLYKFDEQEINKCREFSEKIDTSFYAARNQFDNEKRKNDQLVGKLGEILSFNYLKDKVNNLTYPDFKIYDKKNKSWDFDLKGDKANIHVKSQNIIQSNRYGESWIFQAGNKKYKNYDKEIFDKISDNQYVCFCIVDLKEFVGYLKIIVSLDVLHNNNLFKLPKLEKLQQANKLAVYYSDLKSLNLEFAFK